MGSIPLGTLSMRENMRCSSVEEGFRGLKLKACLEILYSYALCNVCMQNSIFIEKEPKSSENVHKVYVVKEIHAFTQQGYM